MTTILERKDDVEGVAIALERVNAVPGAGTGRFVATRVAFRRREQDTDRPEEPFDKVLHDALSRAHYAAKALNEHDAAYRKAREEAAMIEREAQEAADTRAHQRISDIFAAAVPGPDKQL